MRYVVPYIQQQIFFVTDKLSDAKRVAMYRREKSVIHYGYYRGTVLFITANFRYSKKHRLYKYDILRIISETVKEQVYTLDEFCKLMESFKGKWQKSVDDWIDTVISLVKSKPIKRHKWSPKPREKPPIVRVGEFKQYMRSGKNGYYYVPKPILLANIYVASGLGYFLFYFVAVYQKTVWIGTIDDDGYLGDARFVIINRNELVNNTKNVANYILQSQSKITLKSKKIPIGDFIVEILGTKDEWDTKVLDNKELNYRFSEIAEALKKLYTMLKIIS